MDYRTIDLYDWCGIERGNRTSGYITTYIQHKSHEVLPRIRPAMLVIPGGGYGGISEREKEPIALRFMNYGYASFTLNYAVNTAYPVPLLEACMAVAYLRENAEELGIDSAHIAACGFSAGGHLASMLATLYNEKSIVKALGKHAAFCRPDAVILSYAVITMDNDFTHSGTKKVICGDNTEYEKLLSTEKCVTSESAPAFIWHTTEDSVVPVENSLMMASAYRAHKVPFSLHIFEHGEHGVSLAGVETNDAFSKDYKLAYVAQWIPLAVDWLNVRGFQVQIKK